MSSAPQQPEPGPRSPLTVVIVISDLEYGGAQRQVIELVNHVAPGDAEVHLVSLSADHLELRDKLGADVNFHVIHKKSRFDVSVVRPLAALLRRVEADVVHGVLFDAEITVRLAGRLARTTLIVGSERNADYVLKPQQRIAYRLTHSLRHSCIANSRAGASFNARTLRYPDNHYDVIYNGVDTQRFVPVASPRSSPEMDPDATYVGMIGSFKRQKNHPMFFRVARLLCDAGLDVRFLLVGDSLADAPSDSYKHTVLEVVRELGIEDRCDFVGNHPSVEAVYPRCAITLLPSFFEGTPNVALESMACAVPVVATDVSDNALVIPDGDVGHIVRVDDDRAMAEHAIRLLNDSSERAAMGKRARDWVAERFSLQALARNTLEVYNRRVMDRLGRGAIEAPREQR